MLKSYKSTMYACYFGYVSQAIICTLAPLFFIIFQTQFNLNDEQIGRLILYNFGVQILADVFATRYVDRIGYRPCAIAAHILCTAGIVGMAVFPFLLQNSYMGLTVSVFLYAAGGGLIEVLISPIVQSLPSENKAKTMSLLHSFFCWGQLVVVVLTTVALKILGNSIWRGVTFVWALIPFAGMLMFTKVPLREMVSQHEKTPVRKLLSSKFFVLALLMMMAAGSSELTMSQWASFFAEKGLGVNKFVGDLLGPGLFAVFMGTTRALYGVKGDRLKLDNALIASATMCLICYALAVYIGNPIISLLGCALCGVSVALMWPGTISQAAARYPVGGTAMFGLMAIFGDIGGSVGPWLSGLVSERMQSMAFTVELAERTGLAPEQLGLKAGILLMMIFPALMLICSIMMKRMKMRPC